MLALTTLLDLVYQAEQKNLPGQNRAMMIQLNDKFFRSIARVSKKEAPALSSELIQVSE